MQKSSTRVVLFNSSMKRSQSIIGYLHSQICFGSKLADEFIKVRVGGDMALMNGVSDLIEWDAIDHTIESYTENWSDLVAGLEKQSGGRGYLYAKRC